jgi:hypothetical protein
MHQASLRPLTMKVEGWDAAADGFHGVSKFD